MQYYKLNGQPALDWETDGGSAAASAVQGGFGSAAVDATGVISTGGGSTAADFPDIEEIVGHSPGTETVASADSSTVTTNGSTTASSTTQTVTSASSGLVFNNTFGSGATQAFINEVDAAENYLQSLFGNACTVNCSFSVQNLDNPNISGENSFDPITVTYSQFVNALTQHASTPEAKAAAASLASLPDPSDGAPWEISVGEAQILGLASPDGVIDDSIVLNSQYWTSSALAGDPTDAEAVIEHELSEGIMGRIGSLGIAEPGYWAPMDLFRFTASGQRDFTGGSDGQLTYFSVNGSNVNTGLQYHNSVNSQGQFDGEDLADWDAVGSDANAHDPFGPGGPGVGDPGTLSATDIQIMEALGWAPPAAAATAEMIMQDSSGNYYIYDLGNNSIQGSNLLENLGTGYTFGGIGNFGGDSGDMMLRASNGDLEVYDISNNQITGTHDLGAVGLDWTIAGFGDFSGNAGETDLIMHQSGGALELYDISHNQVTFAISLGNFGSNTVAGFGDFSGNPAETDMMMRSSAGALIVYDMGKNSIISGPIDLGAVGLEWEVYGFGDFSSNPNETDLIMRDMNNGSFELYDISGNRVVGAQALGAVGLEWTLAGFGDFSGNAGETDMMLRDSNNGDFEVYDLADNRIYSAVSAGQVTLSNTVSGTGPDVAGSDTELSTAMGTGVAPASIDSNTGSAAMVTSAASSLVQAMSFFSAPAPMVNFSPTITEVAGTTPMMAANPLQHTG